MQHILIILNTVKNQYDIVVSVIHASRNSYDVAFTSYVLFDDEVRQRDLLFDLSLSVANVMVKSSDCSHSFDRAYVEQSVYPDSSQSQALNSGQHSSLPHPHFVHSTPDYQSNSTIYGRGRGRGHGHGNNRPHSQLCDNFGNMVQHCSLEVQCPFSRCYCSIFWFYECKFNSYAMV